MKLLSIENQVYFNYNDLITFITPDIETYLENINVDYEFCYYTQDGLWILEDIVIAFVYEVSLELGDFFANLIEQFNDIIDEQSEN